jgi:hypothetical protein
VFIAAQVGGGIAGVAIIRILYPALTAAQAAGVVVPHESANSQEPAGFPGPTVTRDGPRVPGGTDG